MDIGEDLKHSFTRAVDGILRVLGLPLPDAERVGAALAKVRGYKPAQTGNAKKPETKARVAPRYFGLLAEIDFAEVLEAHFSRREGGALDDFWDVLKSNERIAHKPHVTIVHSKQLPEMLALWQRCAALSSLPTPPLFRVRLVSLGNMLHADVIFA